MTSKVAIVYCQDYRQDRVDAAVAQAAELCLPGGWPGRMAGSALVKPNVLTARPPGDAVTTHPAVLSAVIRFLRERGFSDLAVGDSSAGSRTRPDVTDRALKVSGLADAALASGAELVSFDREEMVTRQARGSSGCKTIAFARRVVDAQCLVSVPKLKTHSLTLLTGAVKNLYGAVPGGAKREYHRLNPSLEGFADLLLDIVDILRPALSVVDAIVGMEGSGPSAGTPREVGLIVAGTDPVAVDVVLSAITGIDPMKVPTTRQAAKRGLGRTDLSEIEIVGVPLEKARVRGFRKPVTVGFIPHVPPTLTRMVLSFTQIRPVFAAGLCTRCGICVRNCPVDAIRLTPERPELDRARCIVCCCCHELCPRHAITLSRRRLRFGLPGSRPAARRSDTNRTRARNPDKQDPGEEP